MEREGAVICLIFMCVSVDVNYGLLRGVPCVMSIGAAGTMITRLLHMV